MTSPTSLTNNDNQNLFSPPVMNIWDSSAKTAVSRTVSDDSTPHPQKNANAHFSTSFKQNGKIAICNTAVATNLTDEEITSVLKWMDENDNVLVDVRNADLYFREVPSKPHSRAVGRITRLIGRFDDNNGSLLKDDSDGEVLLYGRTVLNPDASFTPNHRGRPRRRANRNNRDIPFPSFVVEVGLLEDMYGLHSLAVMCFHQYTDIQLYLAVKLWNNDRHGTWQGLIFLYERDDNAVGRGANAPTTVLSFGTVAISDERNDLWTSNWGLAHPIQHFLDANGNATLFSVPTASLYDGNPNAVNMPANIILDLQDLQQEIEAVMY
eukprot:CAMPEP_0117444706 /NCGR_PEP_ID=MMETSP0759-20121206/5389_1 /TAXON_ID=63605 /ORGANISM="Percolomonas cosmopolitus, Strain WS" /LENGTH=322 /DNA_ID=CAMNT_0005236801 /DNA_START=779 /DNA_END=1748 /DNA_ORIENTATION=+